MTRWTRDYLNFTKFCLPKVTLIETYLERSKRTMTSICYLLIYLRTTSITILTWFVE